MHQALVFVASLGHCSHRVILDSSNPHRLLTELLLPCDHHNGIENLPFS